MAGDEIGVKVRQEDVADLQIVFAGERQVLVHVALRIDDRRRPGLFVADEI
jgi:hypothetical protein